MVGHMPVLLSFGKLFDRGNRDHHLGIMGSFRKNRRSRMRYERRNQRLIRESNITFNSCSIRFSHTGTQAADITALPTLPSTPRFLHTSSRSLAPSASGPNAVPDFSPYRASGQGETNKTLSYFMVGSLGVLAASGAKSTVADIISNMAASADVLALAKIEVEMKAIPEGESRVLLACRKKAVLANGGDQALASFWCDEVVDRYGGSDRIEPYDGSLEQCLALGMGARRLRSHAVLGSGKYVSYRELVMLMSSGKNLIVKWRGKPVFIRHRTPDEIDEANQVDVKTLRDPQKDEDRVQRPEW